MNHLQQEVSMWRAHVRLRSSDAELLDLIRRVGTAYRAGVMDRTGLQVAELKGILKFYKYPKAAMQKYQFVRLDRNKADLEMMLRQLFALLVEGEHNCLSGQGGSHAYPPAPGAVAGVGVAGPGPAAYVPAPMVAASSSSSSSSSNQKMPANSKKPRVDNAGAAPQAPTAKQMGIIMPFGVNPLLWQRVVSNPQKVSIYRALCSTEGMRKMEILEVLDHYDATSHGPMDVDNVYVAVMILRSRREEAALREARAREEDLQRRIKEAEDAEYVYVFCSIAVLPSFLPSFLPFLVCVCLSLNHLLLPACIL
jgi:hypothetical protein